MHEGLVAARSCQGQLDRVGDVFSTDICAQLPGDDVVAVIVQDRAQIIPTAADDLEVGEVGLPTA